MIVAALGAVIFVGCSGGQNSAATKTTTVTAAPVTITVTATAPATAPTVTATPTQVAGTTIPGEGTFRVGVDVQPGTYMSSPSESGLNCWGYRLRDLSGDPSSVINTVAGKGPVYVTIEPSDGAFKSEQCQTWQKVG
jgi:hypothetical protein